MPDLDEDDPIIQPSNPTAASGQPTGGVAPAATPTEPTAGPGEGVTQVKHSDWKRIKQEQRDQGRRAAMAELDERARAAGFASHEEALRALAAMKAQPASPTPTTPPTPPATPSLKPKEPATMSKPASPQPKPPTSEESLRREAERANAERQKTRKQWRAAEAKRRELQSQLDAKDAEMALRDECYRHGVQDVDYTIRLLTRQLEGKSQEEIAKFDRAGFYTSLRADKPYLFGEKVAPATTGADPTPKPTPGAAGNPAPGAAPATPAPGAPTNSEADEKKFDARKAKPEEVQERLRSLGLNPHIG